MIAAILGGGPSLPEQLREVPEDAVLFGVNHHASKLVDCDYIVFNDHHTWELVKHLPGKKISRWRDRCDIYFESPQGQISGVVALRYALSHGFCPVLLAGFDCYTKDEYFHSPGVLTGSSGARRTLKENLEQWPLDYRVMAVGGPLTHRYNAVPEDVVLDHREVEITEAKTVVLDERAHVNFVPGVQVLRPELIEAARRAGILKETI